MRQHLWKMAALLHSQDLVAKELWLLPNEGLLDNGNIEALLTHLREIAAAHTGTADLLDCPWVALPDQSFLLTVTSP